MGLEKIQQSIKITVALMLMIMVQHLINLFEYTQISISVSVNVLTLLLAILFFFRFYDIFKNHLFVDTIKWQVFGLGMCYTFLILATEISKALRTANAIGNLNLTPV